MILPVLEKLETKSIISLGTPDKKINAKKGNCQILAWLSTQEREEAMKNAKLIVFSGGHMSCFETVKYAKPSICIPTQPEQMGNAAKLQKLNCAISVKNTHELSAAVQKIEEEHKLFTRSIRTLNAFSSKFNGLDRAVEIIENAA
jgi:uncharacterized protein (TIGR00661 family)